MKVSFNWRAINYWRAVHGAAPIPAPLASAHRGALIAALILFALSLSACAMAPNSLRPEIGAHEPPLAALRGRYRLWGEYGQFSRALGSAVARVFRSYPKASM